MGNDLCLDAIDCSALFDSNINETFFRDIIRNCTNASEHDAVVFVGSGCTATVHKFISALGLSKTISSVVFVGPFEHHSNILPWKEIGAQVIIINVNQDGLVDVEHLKSELKVIYYLEGE